MQGPPESKSFSPGDVLLGSIGVAGNLDEVRFLAVAGSTLTVDVDVITGDMVPLVSLHPVKGTTVTPAIATATITMQSGSAIFEIPKLGQYALQIEGENGTTGSYRLTTSIELPPLASPQNLSTTATKMKNQKWYAEAKITAIAGGRLDAVITAPQGALPSIALIDPTGHDVTKILHDVTVTGNQLTITRAPLTTSGNYRLRAFGGSKGDSFTIDLAPSPPASGLTLKVD